jgi:hypothetical protein
MVQYSNAVLTRYIIKGIGHNAGILRANYRVASKVDIDIMNITEAIKNAS